MKKNQTRKIIKFRHQLNTASPPLKHRLKHHSHTSRKYLQGWECHHQHHFSEEIFPDTQCKRPLAQLEAISSCSITRSLMVAYRTVLAYSHAALLQLVWEITPKSLHIPTQIDSESISRGDDELNVQLASEACSIAGYCHLPSLLFPRL